MREKHPEGEEENVYTDSYAGIICSKGLLHVQHEQIIAPRYQLAQDVYPPGWYSSSRFIKSESMKMIDPAAE